MMSPPWARLDELHGQDGVIGVEARREVNTNRKQTECKRNETSQAVKATQQLRSRREVPERKGAATNTMARCTLGAVKPFPVADLGHCSFCSVNAAVFSLHHLPVR